MKKNLSTLAAPFDHPGKNIFRLRGDSRSG
jgi:hypothetical protein